MSAAEKSVVKGALPHEALLGAQTVARLAGVKTLLANVPGFLYLPIFVPDEVTGQWVQAYLAQDLQPRPFVVSWPVPERAALESGIRTEPSAAQGESALQGLLKFLDSGISRQTQGGTLMLNACSLERYSLARRFAPFLNQRREALRQRGLRLILLWPSEPALRQHLIESCADLWAMRAASPIVDKAVHLAREQSNVIAHEISARAASTLLPHQEQQLMQWSLVTRSDQAHLSQHDALALLYALAAARQWSRLEEFALKLQEELATVLHSASGDEVRLLYSQTMEFLGLAKAEQGDVQAGLYWAKMALDEREQWLQNTPQDIFVAHAPDLARSLGNLSNRLAQAGERAQALLALERACELIAPFATPNTQYADWHAQMLKRRDALRRDGDS